MDNLHAAGGLYPPLSPIGEAPANDSGEFSKSCEELFSKAYSAKKATLGAPILTQNSVWGRVLRADFVLGPEPNTELVNRFLCWEPSPGKLKPLFAIGQQIPPLNANR